MAHQQDSFKAQGGRDVQSVSHEVGAFHNRDFLRQPALLPQKIQAIIARRQDQLLRPSGSCLPLLQGDGVHNGLLAHGLHNAAGAQNGQTPFHPQHGVEAALCQGFALWKGDHHGKPALIAAFLPHRLHLLADHLPGHTIDGGTPHRLIQTGFGHPAHAGPAVNYNLFAGNAPDLSHHFHAVGHIGVVPGVLDHRTFGHGVVPGAAQGLHCHRDALGRHQD